MTSKTLGTPLPERERQAIRRLVAERGERQACVDLQVAAATLARAIAGMPLARGTLALMRERMGTT